MAKSKSTTAPVYKSTARRTYIPTTDRPFTWQELPFNFRSKRSSSHWHVPPTDDYGLACRTGREYAAHFIQFLKDNPSSVGMPILGSIAGAIDFSDESGAKGYWVGFFAHLERYIHAGALGINVFDDADKLNAHQIKLVADYENEGGQ
ncbi:hypothetical protein SAMN05216428_11287 [Nitrosospira sp. Nsp11]|uniref:hypothetical protein n=1 Tax=Nitrosospira sp. Nsp11 TaxID=1855338 RepID=UPI0009169A96|nr:hypothetical protein [Nitrosospira sp. Nsp11]SHM05397.1 hypothetical protein SAMN05216428_11287 [Nitrosospira sp. Nsp11]